MALVNGIRGSVHYGDGNWQGFSGDDVEVIIDLGKITDIHSISAGFLQNITSWIFLPSSVGFWFSDDGSSFEKAGEFLTAVPMEDKEAIIKNYSRTYNDLKARYVKVIAKNPGPCPEWHHGAGSPSWVFIDEVVIE